MQPIVEREQSRQQSVLWRQTRLNLLAELKQLKGKLCDKYKAVGINNKSALYTCSCPATTRARDIVQESLTLTNERSEL